MIRRTSKYLVMASMVSFAAYGNAGSLKISGCTLLKAGQAV